MILAASIVWFIIVLVFFIIFDYQKWLKRTDVQHKAEWWAKAACCLPSAAGFSYIADHWYFALPASLAMIGFTWWEFFDGIYNKLRGFEWRYNGSAEGKENDSWLDKKLRPMSDFEDASFKWGGIIAFTLLYIIS